MLPLPLGPFGLGAFAAVVPALAVAGGNRKGRVVPSTRDICHLFLVTFRLYRPCLTTRSRCPRGVGHVPCGAAEPVRAICGGIFGSSVVWYPDHPCLPDGKDRGGLSRLRAPNASGSAPVRCRPTPHDFVKAAPQSWWLLGQARGRCAPGSSPLPPHQWPKSDSARAAQAGKLRTFVYHGLRKGEVAARMERPARSILAALD